MCTKPCSGRPSKIKPFRKKTRSSLCRDTYLFSFQLHAYMCFCNEDNCNTQRECVCGGEGGLKCQVCGGEANDGMCEDQNDNGDSKTCPEGTVCAYFKDGNYFHYMIYIITEY